MTLVKCVNLLRKNVNWFKCRRIGIAGSSVTGNLGNKDSCVEKVILGNNDNCENNFAPVFRRALTFPEKVAIKDQNGEFKYGDLLRAAEQLASDIGCLSEIGSSNRIAYLCPNDITYLIAQWGCWFAGHIAVPLSSKLPVQMQEYYLKDSDPTLIITTPEYEEILGPLSKKLDRKLIIIDKNYIKPNDVAGPINMSHSLDATFYKNSNAMILYTSGTTGKPKGVVLSHTNIMSQINSLNSAWQMNQADVLLHVLPLNHVHGTVNALLLPLYNGSKVIMLPKFDSTQVWSHLLNINMKSINSVSVFMAVPTIYDFLIKEYTKAFSNNTRLCEYIKVHCKQKVRLMVSGSAPLPLSVYAKWNEITGHNLLERYGMTEIGMALSNSYIEDKSRRRMPGFVGSPLPGVEVRIVDGAGTTLHQAKGEQNKSIWCQTELPQYDSKNNTSGSISGDLQVRGESVFTEYWRKPNETKKELTADKWFRTGDTASFENDTFKILGRTSVDIIKSGGHKISALEIENILRENTIIADVAICGVADITWGQSVAALIVLRPGVDTLDQAEFKEWCSTKIPSFMTPTIVKIVEEIPRNAMGKVNKKQILSEFFNDGTN